MRLGLTYGMRACLEDTARYGRTEASPSQLPLSMGLQSIKTLFIVESYREMTEQEHSRE